MNTAEKIQKLAMYKLAIATGDMEIGKTNSTGTNTDKPKKLKKDTTLFERLTNKMVPEISTVPTGLIAHGLEEYGNLMTDQSTPIGELFSDFAKDQISQKGFKDGIYYTQTQPRSYIKDQVNSSPLKKIWGSITSPKTEAVTSFYPRAAKGEEIKNIFSGPLTKDIQDAMKLEGRSDVLDKAVANADDMAGALVRKIRSLMQREGKSFEEAQDLAIDSLKTNTDLYKNPRVVVKAPRNNLRALAHEYGHVEDEIMKSSISKSKIGPVYDFLRTSLAAPSEELYMRYTPEKVKNILGKVSDKINSTAPGLWMNKNFQSYVLGKYSPLPAQAVALTKGLGIIAPDTMDKLKEKDPTGILNFVDEHPVASSIIAGLPHMSEEIATTIPGTKMTYKFWQALKDENNQFMKNHVFADSVRKGIKDLSKISPGWEAAKFFGKNLGKTTLGITAPIISMLAVGKVKDWLGGKDESSVDEPVE